LGAKKNEKEKRAKNPSEKREVSAELNITGEACNGLQREKKLLLPKKGGV